MLDAQDMACAVHLCKEKKDNSARVKYCTSTVLLVVDWFIVKDLLFWTYHYRCTQPFFAGNVFFRKSAKILHSHTHTKQIYLNINIQIAYSPSVVTY